LTVSCALCGSNGLLPAAVEPEPLPASISTFAQAEAGAINVLVAAQKTVAARTSDTIETARQEGLETVERLIRLREREDINFAIKTKNLARRMHRESEHFASPPILAYPTTGAEFLEALILASRSGPITNLVIFGHAAATALYMIEDRGFYAKVDDVAKLTSMVGGTEAERAETLRNLGARDLGDLESLIKNGKAKFAKDAVIVFAGCGVAGATEVEPDGIASRLATITGATIIASIGVTDQSMSHARGGVPRKEYSRGTWVRFAAAAKPENLYTKVLDPLRHMRQDRVLPSTLSTTGALELMRAAPMLPQLRCAGMYMSDNISSCGASNRHNAVANVLFIVPAHSVI
jgi:hypothetical protein